MIDLHMHTTCSDGELSPKELIGKVKKLGYSAIAITDHDNVDAFPIETSEIRIIPGIEITVFEEKYKDLHILGLFVDPSNERLKKKLSELKKQRLDQKLDTIKRLNSLGYEISYEEVKQFSKGAIGRPHIAKTLVAKYPKEFNSVKEVFDKLLAEGKPGYVERKDWFSLNEAIKLIHEAGGVAFLAHPLLYKYNYKELIAYFASLDGDGVEAYYDYVKNGRGKEIKITDIYEVISLCDALELLKSGGSDFHGSSKKQRLGEFVLSDKVLKNIERHL